MLLQKIHNEPDKAKSGSGLRIVLIVILLAVAYVAGYYERSKTHPPTPDGTSQASDTTVPVSAPPAEETAASVPLATPAAAPSATPGLIGAMTPVRVEKAVAVAPSTPAPPVAAPPKPANQVTITQAVEIPVRDEGGKITGYINLQKGQVITPVSVENDQIKIKSGNGFLMVPVASTDMAH